MPRGFGMGRGGYWRYHNRRYWGPPVLAEPVSPDETADGAVYIGPCRCGHGPNAFYRTADGRTVHAADARFGTSALKKVTEPTKDALQEELESLMVRVRELERRLKESPEAGRH